MSYENSWEENGLYRKFTGEITGEEILTSNFELHSDYRFRDIKYIINDFTDVTGHSIEPVHADVYVKTDDIISNTKGKLKIALVVSRDDLTDLATYYKNEMKDKLFDCEIFESVEDARVWVDR